MMTLSKCPKCLTEFTKQRKNQQYCSPKCQKNSQRTTRTKENAERNRDHYGRANAIQSELSRTPRKLHPQKVLGFLEQIVEGDNKLRNILTDPKLLGSTDLPPTAARIADTICRHALDLSIIQVIRKITSEGADLAPMAAKLQSLEWPVRLDAPPPPRPANWDYRLLLPQNLKRQIPNPPPHNIYEK